MSRRSSFFDAHYAGGRTVQGNKEVPLYEELAAIAVRPHADLIIADDFRLFGQTGISGSEGNEVYPPMTLQNWTTITLERCLDVFRDQGKRIEYCCTTTASTF